MATKGAERDWLQLVAMLNTWGSAEVIEPGLIEFISDDAAAGSRRVEIVLSVADWETMWTVAFGDLDEAARSIRRSFAQLGPEDRFLVYNGQYEVVPSPDRNVPVDPEEVRFRQFIKEHPPGSGSHYGWFANPPRN